MAHLRRGAVAVVGDDFDDNRHVAGAVAFVDDLFIVDGTALARCLLDGARNVVVGHIVGFRLCDDIAELVVVDRIRAAFFDRDGDFSADFGEDLAALGVGLFLFIFNVCPLGMS